jgi:signal peptidase I
LLLLILFHPASLLTWGFDLSVSTGGSMIPEIRPGDRLLTHRFAFPLRKEIRVGDIVVYHPSPSSFPEGLPLPSGPFAHRVVAVPGDTVDLDPPHLIRNGEIVTSPLPRERPRDQAEEQRLHHDQSAVHLGDDEFWVLGDQSEALDSRYLGPVRREQMQSRVIRTVLWPWSFLQDRRDGE